MSKTKTPVGIGSMEGLGVVERTERQDMTEPTMPIPLPDGMARLMELKRRQAREIARLRDRVFELEADPHGGDAIPLGQPRSPKTRGVPE